MEERARFVLEALEGWESMSELCARYGVSRRVGYKWLERYRKEGLSGLADRSRAPHHQREATPQAVVAAIITLRKQHPTWGPRKLKAWLERKQPRKRWPACSTIGSILKRNGLTKPRRRRTMKPSVWWPPRTAADAPNRVWTADFKGEFRLGSGRLCYPLTIVDAHSRFLLDCRGLPSTATAGAQYFVSETLRGQTVGLEFQDCGDWNIYFGPCLVAVLDEQHGLLRRICALVSSATFYNPP